MTRVKATQDVEELEEVNLERKKISRGSRYAQGINEQLVGLCIFDENTVLFGVPRLYVKPWC